jgi:hypothetical protein
MLNKVLKFRFAYDRMITGGLPSLELSSLQLWEFTEIHGSSAVMVVLEELIASSDREA